MDTALLDPQDTLPLDEASQRLLFTDARTANTFTDDPVSDAQLRAIYELAKLPPTAANINPLRILFIRPGEARERLVPLMAEGNRDKTARAPVVAVLASDLDFHERIPELFPARPELRDHFGADDELREAMARYSGALQAGYFILAVRAAGLAAGPMGGFDSAGVDAEFFAGTQLRSHLVVNIGVPGPHAFERLPRLAYEDAVTHA
ncbi:MAG: 3-hydroxypropanoate dehydrogenase [Solirubrobacteraceae bacterium]|nr:3-hydroxypropanoate dehydrogenase [Solirubrobacteraceae bacterium]